MPTINYVASDGRTTAVEVTDGTSVMQAAMSNGIGGIVAECGGSIMCATCHVYVREPWASKLPPPEATELAMLEMTASERKPNSRLSCQVIANAGTDGIIVDLPAVQV